jgi:glyoxylase-like metal-dependent hydrolase (beta-lactamase superfamily II)
VRVVSLHPDVLVATSRIWQTTCTIVRAADETFVIDSPILPDELEILPALIEQSHFPGANGLLITHADWDHLLARLAFPQATLGCAGTSAQRMSAAVGAPQRELRAFDERHYLQRPIPLALAGAQVLDVPGSCEIGPHKLALHPAPGHTLDGMAIGIGWAGVLVLGDFLSTVEIPVLGEGGSVDAYLSTLERLRGLLPTTEYVVPGHGHVLDPERALTILEEDVAYLSALRAVGEAAELPHGRRTKAQRAIHAENVARVNAG